jgi:cytochrome oxidase Cu insertion factor (SCO1/SenC/PrrC family)
VSSVSIVTLGNSSRPAAHLSGVLTSCRVLLRALLGLLVVGSAFSVLFVAASAARADGDPGSDVLVYQNLFVAADANMPVPRQVELGNLLTAAGKAGFPIRVAIISQPSDLGAITALWGKPDAYARFLGTELSLAYTQRLLIVMPGGFGFSWQGHSAAAAYQVIGKLRVAAGGDGLGATAEAAVQALAGASGVRLAAPVSGANSAAANSPAAASPSPAPSPASAGQLANSPAPSGPPMSLIVAIAVAVVAVAGLGGWLARRAGLQVPGRLGLSGRPSWLRPPRLAGRGTWLAGGFTGLAVVAIVVHSALAPASGPERESGAAPVSQLTGNQNLDPGASLSGTAPGFTLTDQFGQPVSLSAYRGKVVILAFNDAECTTICPLTTTALTDAKAMLGPPGSQVQLLGIDANPKAIEVEDLLSYSQLHGMTYQWRYLTGTLAQLKSVWKAYSVGVTISQSQTDHEPAIFIIDPEGRLRKLYLTQLAYTAVPQLGQLLATEAASLLPGHPKVQSHLSYAQVGGITPASGSQLPRAAGGYVPLGPGQPAAPRLYLFFATWDQEITSLSGHLDALDAYQSAAAAAGVPGLTAIDEGSVEPSATALPGFLGGLRQPLSYPVAIDSSGQVADGYGVQGQPWFVLADAHGRVIWSWEVSTSGWLSTAGLEQHVRSALGRAAKTSQQP